MCRTFFFFFQTAENSGTELQLRFFMKVRPRTEKPQGYYGETDHRRRMSKREPPVETEEKTSKEKTPSSPIGTIHSPSHHGGETEEECALHLWCRSRPSIRYDSGRGRKDRNYKEITTDTEPKQKGKSTFFFFFSKEKNREEGRQLTKRNLRLR